MTACSKSEFQSHAGSIEAGSLRRASAPVPGFQSHAGSIEAAPIASPTASASSRFNPTLVRLRLTLGKGPLTVFAGFNPTLVRLRPYSHPDAHSFSAVFQSHAGSIEAGEDFQVGGNLRAGFNPTLVRLRLGNTPMPCSPDWGFNPTLVRLRRVEICELWPLNNRFNPTLVRLRRELWPLNNPDN